MNGQEPGTSTTLTVSEASSRMEGLLSDDTSEDTQPAAQPAPSPSDAPAAPDSAEEDTPTPPADAESDAEPEGESDPPDESDAEDEPEEPTTFAVKVDGAEVQVTLDELRNGYSRQADYTRKTQALAQEKAAFQQERAQFQPEVQAVRVEREQLAASLGKLQALVQESMAEPDWDALRESDPAAYAVEYADFYRQQQRLAAINAERQRLEEQVFRDRQTQQHDMLQAERTKLLAALPTWSEAAVARAEKADIAEYARTLGLSDAEVGQIVDHRVLVVLRKAMLYDRVKTAPPAPKPKTAAPAADPLKVPKPGPAPSTRKPVSDLTRAKQAHAKLNSVESAAQAFMHLID